jgi:hypothetical protein
MLDGGTNTSDGSRGANAIQYGAENVIRFPSGRTFLPDSRAKERELFIRDLVVIGFVCVTASWVGCLLGASLCIGKLVVAYLSGGA